MGMLVDGRWQSSAVMTNDETGHFVRMASTFRDWVPVDANPNRYHLYISYACPWACRALAFLALKGLQDCISYSTVDAILGDSGWSFGREGEETRDPLYQKSLLQEIYLMADPKATCKVTVPVLWDKQENTIVNNESSEIVRMFNSHFNAHAKDTTDYRPEALATEIDQINDYIYENINNGVYRCGFATWQAAYEEAYHALFASLDVLEQRLSEQRFLVGNQLTEADWRFFTTLIRFDLVYVGHFKCNKKRIEDYPALREYLRELYQHPGIKQTVRFDHIKTHYYASHSAINPIGIVPLGPEIDFDRPYTKRF